MEINGDDSFRIRSYRRAAEAIEGFPEPGVRPARRAQEAAGDSRHRQGHGGQHQGAVPRRQARGASGAAGEVPALDAGAAEDPGARPEDHRADLERVPGERPRRRGEAGARGQAARAAAPEREERAEDPEGHRELPPHLRPLSARRSRPHCAKAHRASRSTSRASRRSRPPARCAAAAKPLAISTCSSPDRAAWTTSSAPT